MHWAFALLLAGSAPAADETAARQFLRDMVRLARDNRLAPVERLDSKHFVAVGNATEDFTDEQLYNCETIYPLFFDHFRKKGFVVREPAGSLHLAIFDSQAGFEAFLGQRMSVATTGVYHRASNRLVIYDYAGNRSFMANKKKAEELGRQLATVQDRQRFSAGVSQRAAVRRADANVGTVMHEVAHQLSFNSGLLNREGDVPLWLAEGLACYCEATSNGAWQGIGEANPMRAQALAGPARGKGSFLPLAALVRSDDWMGKTKSVDEVLLGYGQSWALFRMLMEERPKALRRYLLAIHRRTTPERRLDDFADVFGANISRMERDYRDYMREIARQEARPTR